MENEIITARRARTSSVDFDSSSNQDLLQEEVNDNAIQAETDNPEYKDHQESMDEIMPTARRARASSVDFDSSLNKDLLQEEVNDNAIQSGIDSPEHKDQDDQEISSITATHDQNNIQDETTEQSNIERSPSHPNTPVGDPLTDGTSSIGSSFYTPNAQYYLLTNADSSTPVKLLTNGEPEAAPEEKQQDFRIPSVQLASSVVLTKFAVNPAIKYIRCQIQDGCNNKGLTEIYKEGFADAITSAAKYSLFSLISFINPMPKQYGLANYMMVNKVISDGIFNILSTGYNVVLSGGKINLEHIDNMFTKEYTAEVSWFAIPSLHSMLKMNDIVNINTIFELNPVASGILIGAGSELIELGKAVASNAYYGLANMFDE